MSLHDCQESLTARRKRRPTARQLFGGIFAVNYEVIRWTSGLGTGTANQQSRFAFRLGASTLHCLGPTTDAYGRSVFASSRSALI